MKKSSKRQKTALAGLKLVVVILSMGGFLYQTIEFMMLYWEYPTVVDIQTILPSRLDMPAFTICNSLGYNFREMCRFKEVCFIVGAYKLASRFICAQWPVSCVNGLLPRDFRPTSFAYLVENFQLLPEHHEFLAKRLEEYTNCTIEFGGETKQCNLENVRGPFFTLDDLPQYCYTIYSLWGQPDKKRESISKGAKMKFHFSLNASQRGYTTAGRLLPMNNVPTTPAVQIAVHSPYFLFSPYRVGEKYLGGRSYKVKIALKETHLLPEPYETNCTDYMKTWRERGGKAPINQMGVVQECRMNKMYEALGCVPLTVDYPHNYTICKSCQDGCNYNVSTDECIELARSFNQPCHSIAYETTSEKKYVYISNFQDVESNDTIEDALSNETIEVRSNRILERDCEGYNFYSAENRHEHYPVSRGYLVADRQCSLVDIEVNFDAFQIKRFTYNAKFESLELFSVIGGYMGMWLGVSLLTAYDFIGAMIRILKTAHKKRNRNQVRALQQQQHASRHSETTRSSGRVVTTYYN